jgi:hypothetical protein
MPAEVLTLPPDMRRRWGHHLGIVLDPTKRESLAAKNLWVLSSGEGDAAMLCA